MSSDDMPVWLRFARKFIDEQPVLLSVRWRPTLKPDALAAIISANGRTEVVVHAALYLRKNASKTIRIRPPDDPGDLKRPGMEYFSTEYSVDIVVHSPPDAHISGARSATYQCDSPVDVTILRGEYGFHPYLTRDGHRPISLTR